MCFLWLFVWRGLKVTKQSMWISSLSWQCVSASRHPSAGHFLSNQQSLGIKLAQLSRYASAFVSSFYMISKNAKHFKWKLQHFRVSPCSSNNLSLSEFLRVQSAAWTCIKKMWRLNGWGLQESLMIPKQLKNTSV